MNLYAWFINRLYKQPEDINNTEDIEQIIEQEHIEDKIEQTKSEIEQIINNKANDIHFEKYFDVILDNYINVHIISLQQKINNLDNPDVKSSVIDSVIEDIFNDDILSGQTKKLIISKFGTEDIAKDYIKLRILIQLNNMQAILNFK